MFGAGKAPAPQEDDIETRMFGAGKAPTAKPAAPSTSMDDSDDVYAREFVPPTAAAPAAPTAPAAPAAASNPTDARLQAGTQTAPAGNYDSMTFNQAFAAARQAGAKDFMWRNKKYAVKMASPQTGQTTKFPAGTVKNAAGGQTTTNAGGAATSVTRNSRPVVPGSLRAQQQANQAAATAAGTQKAPAEPAAPAAPAAPVAQTAANLQGISGDQIANHKNYNQYYNQALAGQNTARAQQTAQQVATLKVKADMAKGINEQAPMRGNTFAESVDMMRRLSNMLKG
jgi:hypothetical protein